MAGYNLILKLKQTAANIRNIEDVAASILIRNIRAEARKTFGNGKSGYPYELNNSFQKDETVFYKKDAKEVHVHHPAVNVLEFGIGEQTIRAKNAEYMYFRGKDGEMVAAKEVHIAPKKPTGFIANAIKETRMDLKKQFKGAVS